MLGGARTTTAKARGREAADADGFLFSVGESPGKGFDAGGEWFAEHWQRLPSESVPLLQQQEQEPFVAQQLPGSVEGVEAILEQ